LTTIIVVAYCWSKGTFQSYASSINKHYYYRYSLLFIQTKFYEFEVSFNSGLN
jgi:hypothetical protein